MNSRKRSNKNNTNNKQGMSKQDIALEKTIKPSNSRQGNQSKSRGKTTGGQGRQFSAAASYATGQSGKAPIVKATRDGCNVKHRELLTNLSGTSSSGFVLSNTFALNPGIQATFPWLAQMAQNWETYRFRRLRFCYYTRTGSTTVGSVMFVPDYDAADGQPANESIASSYEDVQEDAPWKDICVPLNVAAMHQPGQRKYIRSSALAANLDIKTYDSGNLFVFTVDSSAAAAWGKLWVEYEVDFFTPQNLSSVPAGTPGGSFSSGGGSITIGNPLGAVPVPSAGTSFVTAADVGGSSVLTFQKTGYFIVTIVGTGTVLTGPDSEVLNNITKISEAYGINAAATTSVGVVVVNVTAVGGTMQLTGGATATTYTNCVVEVASAPFGSLQ